jgi:uncharacterized membrane protein YhaH (DUF805 family)
MNRKPTRRHFPWTAAVIGFLSLIGVGLALAGALDWPLSRSLGLSTGSAAPDFLQAARQVIFNLWFVAVFVTAFALTQQRLKRRAARLAHTPSPSQVTARGQTAAEGGMSRREFLIAGGSAVATTVALAGAGRLLFPAAETAYAAEAAASATTRASSTANTLSAAGQPAATATIVPAATAVPTAQTVVTTGRRLCDRGCSYPGHCGRYRDTNGNGACDNTEAIW